MNSQWTSHDKSRSKFMKDISPPFLPLIRKTAFPTHEAFMTTRLFRLVCLFAIVSCVPSFSFAENWPGWRGPRGDGTSTEQNVPARWSDTENIAWKVKAPAESHASPIIWNDRVFLVGTDVIKKTRLLAA